jgi:hypothetical protein
MNCPERERLFELAQGLVEAREAETLGAHAAACDRCRGTLEEYGRLDAVLDEWRPAEPSPWFDARVRAALQSARRPRRLFGLRLAWLAPVVAVALVLGAVLLVEYQSEFPLTPPRPRTVVEKSPEPAVPEAPRESVTKPAPEPPLVAVNGEDDQLAAFDDLDLFANFEILSELRPGEDSRVN